MTSLLERALRDRAIADSLDRPSWLAARVGKVGGSDAAGYAKRASVPLYVKAKIGEQFQGNAYTNHGNDRERAILRKYGLEQNTLLFAHPEHPRHVATPDAYKIGPDGEIILIQVKTSSKPITHISPAYGRQMLWEQWVMGATRTLFVWEEHSGFQPLAMEPESMWFYRETEKLNTLIEIADDVLAGIDLAAQFRKEMEARS